MDIRRLRQETAEDHQAVEGSLPLMDQTLDRTRYVACLQRMYGIVAAWEEDSRKTAPEWLQESLAARSRQGMLARDLEWLGSSLPTSRPVLPRLDNLPSLLGAMYVMEGSTLGGQLIARHVGAALDLRTGDGNSYFVGHGERTGAMWKSFCSVLTDRVPDEDAEGVVEGARAMFRTFGLWMKTMPVAHGS